MTIPKTGHSPGIHPAATPAATPKNAPINRANSKARAVTQPSSATKSDFTAETHHEEPVAMHPEKAQTDPTPSEPQQNFFAEDLAAMKERKAMSKGSAVLPSPDIHAVCDKMKANVPSAQVLHYIDQTHNEIINNPEVKKAFPGGSGGVCSAMTAEWLKMNRAAPNQAAAVDKFSELCEHKFGNLIIGQADEMHQLTTDEKKFKETLGVEQQLNAKKDLLSGNASPWSKWVNAVSGPSPQQLRLEALALQSRLNAEAPGALALANKAAVLKGGGVAGTPTAEGKFTGNLAFNTAMKDLHANTLQDGYYRLELNPPNTPFSSDIGHVIGLHKTGGPCRVMDPNTAEWQVGNHADMTKLVNQHVANLYYNPLEYGSYNLTHYP